MSEGISWNSETLIDSPVGVLYILISYFKHNLIQISLGNVYSIGCHSDTVSVD